MPADLADLTIDARWILPMTARDALLRDHALIVRDGRIVDLLPQAEAHRRYESTARIDRNRHLLMPGLIDTHTHAALILLRGLVREAPPTAWPNEPISRLERRVVQAEFVRDAAPVAIAQMLKAGVTCFADAYFFPEETGRAAAECGIRAVIGTPVTDGTSPWAANGAQHLTECVRVHDEFKGHPLISTAFAPLTPGAIGDSTLRRVAVLADELDAGITLHLHETTIEIGDCLARHGQRPIARLRGLGLLTPALNAVHMVHLDASDGEIVRQGGLSISLCPRSNLRLGNGLPAAAELAASGLRIAVGTDAGAANNDHDLWAEIKLLALLTRADAGPALTPWDVLSMATRGAAASIGLGAETGALETGKWADLCCIDFGGAAATAPPDPLEQLAFCGGRDMVTDVWVAGRQLLADSRLTRLDWPRVAARAEAWTARLTTGG